MPALAERHPMTHAGRVSGLSVEVARPPSAVEAQLIVGMLAANGIEARSSADDAGGLEPQWQLTGGVRVLVAPEDADAARRLVSEAQPEHG
jgi:hypothetical protein